MAQTEDGSDIEITGYNHEDDTRFKCSVCQSDLSSLTVARRQEHYDRHFEEPVIQKEKRGVWQKFAERKDSKLKAALVDKFSKPEDNFWYPAQQTPPPHNFTPGFIPLIKKFLLKSHSKGNTTRAVLCYERAVHINRRIFDAGWGCGYRNFMMVCATLMDQAVQPLYFPLLDAPLPPGVRNLQETIESAWKDGFDKVGAAQLDGKLYGEKKWIGTGDIWVAFSYRGIPAELVDFNSQHDADDALINWIVKYFSDEPRTPSNNLNDALRGATPVVCTTKMPFILQYKGHSTTIIGYEVRKDGKIIPLSFESAFVPKKQLRAAALACAALNAPTVKVPSTNLKRPNDNQAEAGPSRKRSRSNPIELTDDEDIIIVDHVKPSSTPKPASGSGQGSSLATMKPWDDLTTDDVLTPFRVDVSKLKRKNRYQILYFPLTAPLTDSERIQRKRVVSTRV